MLPRMPMEDIPRAFALGTDHCGSREEDMKDGLDAPGEDPLQAVVSESLRRLLSRREHDQDLGEVLRTLRWQMAKVLAETPMTGSVIDKTKDRARFACVLEAEISRQEKIIRPKEQSPENPRAYEERRRWPRRWVHLSAQLLLGDSFVDCTIVDLSEGGAQVATSHPVPFMEAGVLKVEDGSNYRARCRWVNGTRAGFEFTSGPFVASGG
ncbi:PilZ domain-containing protein [Roseomonas sp. KE2513]|uniref:PilZ domain-containing protein n=1 Tax=Roseomonas sp. KE2513 TaxID=2479202 RepID=UPI0035CC7760|nr:PilZ domain-containing protein [Roseomonas sp. KE2513]